MVKFPDSFRFLSQNKKHIWGVVILVILVFFLIGVSILAFKLHQASRLIPKNPQLTLKTLPVKIPKTQAIPKFDHIALIILENKSLDRLNNDTASPFINSLIKQNALAGNYFALSHPSLPNYLGLLGGSTFGINTDCTDCFISSENLVDRLESVHRTWKAYMESKPQGCFVGNAYPYVQKHDPFIYFDDIRTDKTRCNNIVTLDQLEVDLNQDLTTPNFLWITPNGCSDMHDCTIAQGDAWLKKYIGLLTSSSAFKDPDSLIILTTDEDDNSSNNQVLTLFISKQAKPGYVSNTLYNHYSLLHSIETSWNLPPLTENDANAPLMVDMFN